MDTQYILVVNNVPIVNRPMPLLDAEKWRSTIAQADVHIIKADDAEAIQRVELWRKCGWQFGPAAPSTLELERSTRAQYHTAPDALTVERDVIRMLRSDLARALQNAGNPDSVEAA